MSLPNCDNADFYKQALDWRYDMYQSHTVWLRRLLFLLVILIFLLFLSLSANLFLLPLKEKVPFLYAFDHSTGEITKIGELEKTKFTGSWELARYFLIQYLINYESYDLDHLEIPYQMVWAQSEEPVKKQYEELVKSSNPKSPYKLYGKDKYITVKVNSINKLNENTVDVKFEKTLHDRISNSTHVINKEAIIKWNFSKAEVSQKMLDRDPLGFKVTYYHTTQVNIENT